MLKYNELLFHVLGAGSMWETFIPKTEHMPFQQDTDLKKSYTKITNSHDQEEVMLTIVIKQLKLDENYNQIKITDQWSRG